MLRLRKIVFAAMAMCVSLMATAHAATPPHASEYTLPNGLKIVVIPDHRAPVVTHMLWFRVGGTDDPPGYSGLAHFFEHLMFKGTTNLPEGEFSKTVARNGGQDNAFTTHDYTAFFERIAKDRLPLVMQLEADRMEHLDLSENNVTTERQVVLEERRMRVENDPGSLFQEQMSAALHLSHPYGRPVIGWSQEIQRIGRPEALAYYQAHYAPNNCTLLVVGDVEPEDVHQMALKYYGPVAARTLAPRSDPVAPPRLAETRMSFSSPDVRLPSWSRIYRVPHYVSGKASAAEALEVLAEILGSGPTSRLYKTLVVEKKIAANAGAWYDGVARGPGGFGVYAYPVDGVNFEEIEKEVDAVIADMMAKPPEKAEFERAKTGLIASQTYERDSQSAQANDYGAALSVGLTVDDVEKWADRIKAVTPAQVQQAAKTYLLKKEAVTGMLSPAGDGSGAGGSDEDDGDGGEGEGDVQ